MNAPENGLDVNVSSQTTKAARGVFSRAVWTLGLVAIASALAIHAALAYSPELTRFVPEALIKSSAPSASSCSMATGGGCHARLAPGDFAGCCSLRSVEVPCLTDGVYPDVDSDDMAELPADALECPASAAESARPITTDEADET
jgi:hypothetical protein